MIDRYLDDLEERIDDGVERDLFDEWRHFAAGGFDGDMFSPRRGEGRAAGTKWPEIHINDAIEDGDLMVLRELKRCSDILAGGSGAIMCVRCNYGTGIMSSLFGAEIFTMPRETGTLPTTRPFLESPSQVRELLDRGVPDRRTGLGGKVFDTAERFLNVLGSRPNMGRHVHLYHPDCQGPMDICELLYGSGLFLALLDEANLVHDLLDLITRTYIDFMRAWHELSPPREDGVTVHWSLMHRGAVMLRDDSAMNLSPEMFDEFVRPYNQRLLEEFGGGAMHYCGRGDHFIESASGIDGLSAIALSQPEMNDMETVYRHTVDKGIQLIGLRRSAAEAAVRAGRNLHGNVHCG
jgi:hypothetical protein